MGPHKPVTIALAQENQANLQLDSPRYPATPDVQTRINCRRAEGPVDCVTRRFLHYLGGVATIRTGIGAKGSPVIPNAWCA